MVMKIWTDFSSIMSRFTRVTDRILIAIARLHYMQRGKNSTKILSNMEN